MTTTLLIYMAADNSLSLHAQRDLDRIIQSTQESQIQVAIQYDSQRFVDTLDTLRLYVHQGEILKEENLGDLNTGNPSILHDFIEQAGAYFPADRTLLIIWSHGSGVDDHNPYAPEIRRERYFVPREEIEEIAVGFDDTSGDFLDNVELKKALQSSIKLDLIGFDACLMGMFEIGYQLRDQTHIMVASQFLEPTLGWDYPRIITELDQHPNHHDMGEFLITSHQAYHTHNAQNVTQSALNTDIIQEVAQHLDQFALVLRQELNKQDHAHAHNALRYTLANAQYFSRSDYVDLIDFVQKVEERLGLDALKPHSKVLLEALERFIIANHSVGYPMEDAHGVSIYFPNASRPFKETFELYEKLDFTQACPNWIKLLKWYWVEPSPTQPSPQG